MNLIETTIALTLNAILATTLYSTTKNLGSAVNNLRQSTKQLEVLQRFEQHVDEGIGSIPSTDLRAAIVSHYSSTEIALRADIDGNGTADTTGRERFRLLLRQPSATAYELLHYVGNQGFVVDRFHDTEEREIAYTVATNPEATLPAAISVPIGGQTLWFSLP